jgi:hypothetical protein
MIDTEHIELDKQSVNKPAPNDVTGIMRQRLEQEEDDQSFFAYLMREPSYII